LRERERERERESKNNQQPTAIEKKMSLIFF